MSGYTIEISDQAVKSALNQLQGRVSNLTPIMQAIGESIMERTKQRFATSTGPDGARWRPNAPATLASYIVRAPGKNFRKDGRLNQQGANRIAGKKPLIGHSGDLARQFHIRADATSVTVASSPIYAAIQQFGGKAGRGHKVTIPARPFLPMTAGGELYPQERDLVLTELQRYILAGTQG